MKLSIIIPSHNRPDTIQKVLKNIPNEEWLEIIVIENGNSSKVQKEYNSIQFKSNVTLIHSDDGNLPKSRNIGIKKSVGDYIFHVDDDDEVRNDFLDWVKNSELGLDIYRMDLYKCADKKIIHPFYSKLKFNKLSILKTWEVSTWLIKREFYIRKQIKFNEEFHHGEDGYFSALVFNASADHNYIPIASINYDSFDEAVSMTRNKRKFKDTLKILEYLNTSNFYESNVAIRFLYMSIGYFKNEHFEEDIETYYKLLLRSYESISKIWNNWMNKEIKKALRELKELI